MAEHVALLADLKGTKSGLAAAHPDVREDLVEKLTSFYRAASAVLVQELGRNRSLRGFTFSDSLFLEWSDCREASHNAIQVAEKLARAFEERRLSARLFVEKGSFIAHRDGVGEALGEVSRRFRHLTPASEAVWAVFAAEGSHLPGRMYLGESFIQSLSAPVEVSAERIAIGPFKFRELPFCQRSSRED